MQTRQIKSSVDGGENSPNSPRFATLAGSDFEGVRAGFVLALIVGAALLILCGCDDPAGEDDVNPSSCGFASSGSEGSVTISPGQPLTFDQSTDDAQNTMDLEMKGPIAPPRFGPLRYSPCGSFGLLMKTGDGSTAHLVFVDPRSSGAPEVVDADVHTTNASLFFDTDCAAIAVRVSSGEGLVEYVREDASTWNKTIVLDDFTAVVGSTPSYLETLAANVGRDGRFYVFIQAGADVVRAVRDAAANSSWSFEKLPALTTSILYGYWVDGSGGTHTLYRNTAYPCDPCNVDLLYAQLAPGGEQWSTEVVHSGKWGAPDDEFVESGAIAFDSQDRPFIAAHFTRRVVTGSYASTALWIFGKHDGSWCSEAAVTETDGFAGTDGSRFTGADPQFVIDDNDRFHVVFRDQAIWHADGMQNEIRGQIRYAVRVGSSFYLDTLLGQQGQTESTNPLYGISPPVLAVSPNGADVVVAGVVFAWQTDSIYNESEMPVSFEAQAVATAVSWP